MKESRDGRRTVVEHTSPIWRVLSVALAAGAVAAIGYYLQEIGRAADFATVLVVTLFFSVGFWARKRPDKLRARFGPFGRIANAVRESGDDIRQYVYDRPLRVGVALAACYGVAVVIAKSVVVALLAALYSPSIAVALGCAVGAAVAAPEFFASLLRRLALPPEEDPDPREGAAPESPSPYPRDDAPPACEPRNWDGGSAPARKEE